MPILWFVFAVRNPELPSSCTAAMMDCLFFDRALPRVILSEQKLSARQQKTAREKTNQT